MNRHPSETWEDGVATARCSHDQESRSRFKEEVIRALEGMKKETSQTLLDETWEHFYIYTCEEEKLLDKSNIGYNQALQEAIETIKGL